MVLGVLLYGRCKSCNHVTTTDDVEDWVYHQLEDTTHLLHGVVHANGYGHLLRVNGREGGSMFLSGCHIMEFWDRICRTLGVRLVAYCKFCPIKFINEVIGMKPFLTSVAIYFVLFFKWINLPLSFLVSNMWSFK